MAMDFEIIVGTYEQFLLGYKITNVDGMYNLERSFATHSHLASIRAVASSRHYLASAGADDCVCLYDMRYRMESGRLAHHNGTVNCISFSPESSHIMTASADGSIGMVRCGNWELEKHWKSAHKGCAVNTLAIHPTGKLAMSVGDDGVLRTWNLVKGRQAYATNLVPRLRHEAKNITLLRWSPKGDRYVLAANRRLDVYSVETAGVCAELFFDARLASIEFLRDNILAIGREDGLISFCDVATGTIVLADVTAHDARVKCLAYRDNYLVSGSSSGAIKLWRYGKKGLRELSETSCGARITCMTLAQVCPRLGVKKEEKADDAEREIEAPRKTVFRMRQEVVVEDEDDAKSMKKMKKLKSKHKRDAKVALSNDQTATEPSKKKMTGKAKFAKHSDSEAKGKKKRSVSSEKSDGSPAKKTKRQAAKKVCEASNVTEGENDLSTLTDDVTRSKKKKKKRLEITPDGFTTEPVAKKKKIANGISSARNVSTSSSKARKKKSAR